MPLKWVVPICEILIGCHAIFTPQKQKDILIAMTKPKEKTNDIAPKLKSKKKKKKKKKKPNPPAPPQSF
jgi:hypothetical protein